MKETFHKGKSLAMDTLSGQMDLVIKGSLKIIKLRGSGHTSEMIKGAMLGTGKITSLTVKVLLPGQMGVNMSAPTKTTKNTEKEISLGTMAPVSKAHG